MAQIVPDRTLGDESSIVEPNITIKNKLSDSIKGGAIRENNLFHSFSEFNIPNGKNVYFANPDRITNILTRVTGNNSSEIFGTLGVDGAANLFFLNPNGIVFGENASLDVSGSFLATTADSYIFENSFEYSASNPDIPPLLTVNIPIGLQFGSNTGDIQILNTRQEIITQTDSNLDLLSFAPKNRIFGNEDLAVAPGKTLSFLGGNLTLAGSSLRAEQGRIELGGVDAGFVGIQPTSYGWNLDYAKVSAYKDINLQEFSAIDASGIISQGIQLVGKTIRVSDGSTALVQVFGSAPEADLTIQATELLEIVGSDLESLLSSSISIENFGSDSGDVIVNASNLVVRDGGAIGSRQYGEGKASNVYFNIADSIILDGASALIPSYYSRIGVLNLSSSPGGSLEISTNKLNIIGGANVGSVTALSTGSGGNVNIDAAKSITIDGYTTIRFNQEELPSSINASSFGGGNAGKISVQTIKLKLSNGGKIYSNTFGNADAGEISINASELIEITDTNGSSLTGIGTDNFSFSSGSRVLFGLPDNPSGDSGKTSIYTNRLYLDNSAIRAVNEGTGSGGNLEINVNSAVLKNESNISAATASGTGGNITLEVADSLLLKEKSSINATAKGVGDGGNVSINSNLVSLLEESQILTDAIIGNGGNIKINAKGFFVSNDSLVNASSEFGLDGNIEVETIKSGRIIEIDSLSEKPINASEQITAGCSINNNFVLIGKGGLPENPTQYLQNKTIWQDWRLPNIKSSQMTNQSQLFPESIALREAQDWKINPQGNVELVASRKKEQLFLNNFKCLQNKMS